MVRSKATTVEAYLAELPPERRQVVVQVREPVLKNLPRGYRDDRPLRALPQEEST